MDQKTPSEHFSGVILVQKEKSWTFTPGVKVFLWVLAHSLF